MTGIRAFEHAGWQAAAATFDGFASATALFVAPLLDAVAIKPGTRLLDIACGTGVASGRRLRRARASPASISLTG